ncbi:MAG: hypothetical protein KatS3mg109_0121 [Pirellulaceae bacterium]|nr:MAG: hypothetical protein KatS3mg109_0121 [Pirellulaceae bacterium]
MTRQRFRKWLNGTGLHGNPYRLFFELRDLFLEFFDTLEEAIVDAMLGHVLGRHFEQPVVPSWVVPVLGRELEQLNFFVA